MDSIRPDRMVSNWALFYQVVGVRRPNLGFVARRVFSVRLLRAVTFIKKLLCSTKTSLITLKMQTHAINAR